MSTQSPRLKPVLGFSLIEVMVAVVILATGLLALAALQGALARNSSDAKARSAIVAALTSRMSVIRQGGAGCAPLPATAPVKCDVTWDGSTGWVSAAAAQAGASTLSVKESISVMYWNAGAKKYQNVHDKDAPSFTQATLEATWVAADGTKTLALSSDVSGRIYGDGTGYPNPGADSSASARPVVRQDNPGNEEGVIPIAASTDPNSPSTAASNPKPLLIGQTRVVGTQFDVLSYIPEGTQAKLTRRINTNVIKCRCEFGQSSPKLGVAGKAQWPTVWNGVRYATYESSSPAPGVTKKAGEDAAYSASNGRKQSPLCTECCRDHHDNGSGELYSPEGVATKYNAATDGTLSVATTGKYVAACRVIKNDGIWKTASDLYVRQYGLLATTPSNAPNTLLNQNPELQAADGAPDTRATGAYQNFVKSYLDDYLTSIDTTGSSAKTPAQTKALYDGYSSGGIALKDPELITFPSASVSDKRYMHSRGVLVDFLTTDARTALKKAIDANNCKKADKRECLLPQLPFTTINMTEIAKWSEEGGALNVVDSGTLLASDVNQPFAGRTRGVAPTPKAVVTSKARFSNSGIAFSHDIGAVRPESDEPSLADTQDFSVLGGLLTGLKVSVTGYQEPLGTFTVRLTLPAASDCDPAAEGGLRCPVTGLPARVTMKVEDFNKTVLSTDDEADRVSATCVVGGSTRSADVPMPYKVSYGSVWMAVNGASPTQASISGGTGTWVSPTTPLVQASDTIGLEFRGRAKLCPSTYTCDNNYKGTGISVTWPNASTFSEAACALPPVGS